MNWPSVFVLNILDIKKCKKLQNTKKQKNPEKKRPPDAIGVPLVLARHGNKGGTK